jgi:lipopolysaccharide transport system ATP-binding protein
LRLRNKRAGKGDNFPAGSSEFWALKDVSFSVQRGEVVGIIGRNGAGKSTLLKILSRVTEPTVGNAYIRGRIASLLEVGTGFHPELTGRENIYLNGAILGMTRLEIRRKFDEIVDFSGVERFLDTPVKRYSSGMYVRLAFAVAAHLDPEILVIDEVLAVGDGEFQKKCLGKMSEVAKGGRTILFVSHNLAMISSLCEKSIYLEGGVLRAFGPTSSVISNYSMAGGNSTGAVNYRNYDRLIGDEFVQLLSVDIRNEEGERTSEVEIDHSFSARMEYRVLRESNRKFVPNVHFYRHGGSCAFVVNAQDVGRLSSGDYFAECHVPANFLNDGFYFIDFALTSYECGVSTHFHEKSAVMFNVRDRLDGIVTRSGWRGPMPGAVRPILPWTLKPI